MNVNKFEVKLFRILTLFLYNIDQEIRALKKSLSDPGYKVAPAVHCVYVMCIPRRSLCLYVFLTAPVRISMSVF